MIGSEGEQAITVPCRRDGEAGRRILIVEDNQFVAHLCENALLDAGYEVVATVLTARDAIRAAMDQRPELVLMDIYLRDGSDGIDAALEIRRRFDICSIFVSAPADSTVKARAECAQPIAWLGRAQRSAAAAQILAPRNFDP
jgi:CheY-like chemotaxis protein